VIAAVNSIGPIVPDGSRTVPIARAKTQVNQSVDQGGHNKNRSGSHRVVNRDTVALTLRVDLSVVPVQVRALLAALAGESSPLRGNRHHGAGCTVAAEWSGPSSET